MLFSENECRELAAFFAKRFSEPSVRTMLARQAGIKEELDGDQPDRAWEQLITTAQNRRKLPKLAIVAESDFYRKKKDAANITWSTYNDAQMPVADIYGRAGPAPAAAPPSRSAACE